MGKYGNGNTRGFLPSILGVDERNRGWPLWTLAPCSQETKTSNKVAVTKGDSKTQDAAGNISLGSRFYSLSSLNMEEESHLTNGASYKGSQKQPVSTQTRLANALKTKTRFPLPNHTDPLYL
ncbi:hypothetical protein Nepgr_015518 [Nepenthes gracilis]|uniref:Uncharacterized protein n=1 Tax=Nepenthes gracilis TaxID=150966 RepID=A0AAD3XQG2_NEPGR|nr:hypothetical protein Nepgr_015518 [Nepenthes gracilis]